MKKEAVTKFERMTGQSGSVKTKGSKLKIYKESHITHISHITEPKYKMNDF